MDAEQVRAARAILGWSLDKLQDATGLHKNSLRNIEDGGSKARAATEEALKGVFEENGIELVDGGARRKSNVIQVMDGSQAYPRLLDDIFYATRDGSEVLWFCADDSNPRVGEIEAEERIRSSGTRFRCLVEAGTETIRWELSEYRQIPTEYFNHDLQVIYGHKVAQLINGGEKILIIDNASLARTERNKFNMIWVAARPVRR